MQKPCMYLSNYDRAAQCNEVGKNALACYYIGKSVEDIETFIENVINRGQDALLEKREQFYNEVLLPPNGKSVAENILDEILKGVGR